MDIASLFIIYLVASTSNSCLTSSEEFAAEIVIPQYDLSFIGPIAERIGSQYQAKAEYDPELLVVMEETSFPQGLAVRLQIPTKIIEITKPRLKLVSYSASGTVRDRLSSSFNGWKVTCDSYACAFDKDLVALTTAKTVKSEVTLEINKELAACSQSCTGVCFEATEESKCLDAKTKNDLDSVVRYANISTNFNELLDSYRIIGSEEIVLSDIEPVHNAFIDWQEAMRQELVLLSSKGVINMDHESIESAVLLVKRGQAGQNYRVVYDSGSKEWAYYNDLEDAVLSSVRDCKEYHLPQDETLPVEDLQTFYLVPVIIGTAGVLLLVLLIIIARIVNAAQSSKKRKKK